MTAEEFQKKWTAFENNLITVPASFAAKCNDPATVNFLTQTGLPASAAPFLSFDELASGGQYVTQLFPQKSTAQLTDILVIGSNGYGAPICLHSSTAHILCLDPDFNFKKIFINSHITKFAQSLLCYRQFIHTIQQQHGEDAFIAGFYTKNDLELLLHHLQQTEAEAVAPHHYWGMELKELMSDIKK